MPQLQSLRLWRADDFPWTSIRPIYATRYLCQVFPSKWIESLRTPQSIAQHVAVFEQDLCQLVENLKQLLFIDIYALVRPEKVEAYRSMVKMHFPNSQFHIDVSRFRLWF